MTGQTLAIILSQSAALICLGAYLREYRKAKINDEWLRDIIDRNEAFSNELHAEYASQLYHANAKLRKWTHRPRDAKGHYVKAPKP